MSEHVRRSRRREIERWLSILGWFPYRCADCYGRFYSRGAG
jgi:hypothetical protein